jgi:hypothetical protein
MLVPDAFESYLTLGARFTIHAMNTGCVLNIWKDDFIIKHSTKYTFQRSFETIVFQMAVCRGVCSDTTGTIMKPSVKQTLPVMHDHGKRPPQK